MADKNTHGKVVSGNEALENLYKKRDHLKGPGQQEALAAVEKEIAELEKQKSNSPLQTALPYGLNLRMRNPSADETKEGLKSLGQKFMDVNYDGTYGDMSEADTAEAEAEPIDTPNEGVDPSAAAAAAAADNPKSDDKAAAAAEQKSDNDQKSKYRATAKSIWDAYYNGEIDKDTANYFTIDALATLAKNLGRGVSNIGAQYSGGSVDNNTDTSKWEQRAQKVFEAEAQKETEDVSTLETQQKKANLRSTELANDLQAVINKYSDKSQEAQLNGIYQQLQMNGINIENAEDRRILRNELKNGELGKNIPNVLRTILISQLSHETPGLTEAVNAAGKGIGSAIAGGI